MSTIKSQSEVNLAGESTRRRTQGLFDPEGTLCLDRTRTGSGLISGLVGSEGQLHKVQKKKKKKTEKTGTGLDCLKIVSKQPCNLSLEWHLMTWETTVPLLTLSEAQ